jgi:hypothetical protein
MTAGNGNFDFQYSFSAGHRTEFYLLRNEPVFKFWSAIQQRVYQSHVHNVSELKHHLLDV